MYLEKICVPNFRVLKNVEIYFEKEFPRRIFPLGSLNGGGKSTLLQLIFVLLHCSVDPDRLIFLKNLLNGFTTYKNSDKRILATIDIWEGTKTIQLEFFCCKQSFIENLFNNDNKKEDVIDKIKYEAYVSASKQLNQLNKEIIFLERDLSKITLIYDQLMRLQRNVNHPEKDYILDRVLRQLLEEDISLDYDKYRPDIENIFYSYKRNKRAIDLSNQDINKLTEFTEKILERRKLKLDKAKLEIKELELVDKIFIEILKDNHMIYICDTLAEQPKQVEKEMLICSFKNIDINEASLFLKEISEKIFLAAHVSQVFLFLSPDSRKSLFKSQSKKELNEDDYYTQLRKEKPKLTGFFTYDFMAIDVLIESFKEARDLDFIRAIETGEYGSNYKALLEDLNSLLGTKKININKDFSGVTFKTNIDDIELYPEDLSHGELKRLCIYMWIKHNKIENSIVLMDEIEIAFHADWQYQIVRDIEQWSPNNQYILATHSYELCQAVTPAHVKELEPKLIKR